MTTVALLDNYLFLAPLIERRVQDALPDVPVEAIEQLSQVEGDKRPTVIYVLWSGERFGDSTPRASAQIVTQDWLVLLRQQHMSLNDKDARAQAAGRHLAHVHKAIAGWTPDGAVKPFRRVQGRAPNYTKTDGLFPLTFGIDLYL